MRRIGLATVLTVAAAVLVLVAVGAVTLAAVAELKRASGREALARTALAGAEARAAVEQAVDDVQTSARVLADRPTLRRLVLAGDRPSVAGFLERFRETAGLDAASVVGPGLEVTAGAGRPGAGETASPAAAALVPGLLPEAGGDWIAQGQAPIAGTDASVVAVRRLGATFWRSLGTRLGADLVLRSRIEAESTSAGEAGALLLRAFDGQAPPATRLAEGGFLSLQPIGFASGDRSGARRGEIAAVLAASRPAGPSDRGRREAAARLLGIGAVVAVLLSAAGLVLARRLGSSARALSDAAGRIGAGDLATPLPPSPPAGLGTLAASMDDMRRRLLALTGELHRRQAESGTILSEIAEGVLAVDRDRRIRYLNPQVAVLLGVDAEQVAGRFCGDVLRPRGPGGIRPCEESCPIVHARFRGAASATELLTASDGRSLRVVVTSSAPAEDRQVVVLRDETVVEAARRMRDAVLANLSHEFKTPLAAQLASVELLRDRLLERGEAENERLVRSLERGALRLTQLVDNLLESVRIEAGRDSIRLGPVALDQVVEEAVGLTLPLLEQRGQRVEMDLPYPLPAVEGDASRLTQVFVNLFANANKFADAPSTITVGGRVSADAVTLWVEDEGPGLPPAFRGSIFERFVRSPGGGEPEPGGIGLGLAIVRSIVERHGGSVEAANVGRGVRFSVILPRSDGGTGLPA